MTLSEFLEKLKETNLSWSIQANIFEEKTNLRCEWGDCPILAVGRFLGKKVEDNLCWDKSAEELELNPKIAREIVKAADSTPLHDRELRLQLLEACNVKYNQN